MINKLHKIFKILTILLLCLIISSVNTKGLVTNNDISVRAVVKMQQLQFKIYPEKRIPNVNNWDTFTTLYLLDCQTGQRIHQFINIPTNTNGYGIVDLSKDVVFEGEYAIAASGASHLIKHFGCYNLRGQVVYIDLTTNGKLLLAGETSNSYDNYINSLDISVLTQNIYSNNYYSDLNQDGQVNSLDNSTQIANIYKHGD